MNGAKMNVGIRKPGQGYWVRVLTAIFAGALVLSGALWAWSQASQYRPPTPTWTVNLAAVEGTLEPGVQVDVYAIDENNQPVLVGTATAEDYISREARTGRAILSNINLQGDQTLVTSNRIVVEDIVGQNAPFSAEIQQNAVFGNPAFDVIYVQAAVAGVILLIGAIAVYVYVGSNRRSVDFLIATDGEMKKVNWSTRKEVQGSTVVVIIASFLLAAAIFVVDLGFGRFFKLIGVLEG